MPGQVPQLAERIELGLFTLRRSEKCSRSLPLPTSPSGRYRLVALPTSWVLFISAKNLLVEATPAPKLLIRSKL